MKSVLRWLPDFFGHWLSTTGVVVTTVSGLALLLTFVMDLLAPVDNVYASAGLFLILPPLFLLGLVLIPLGMWLDRRRRRRGDGAADESASLRGALRVFFANPVARRRFWLLAALTAVNFVLVFAVGQRAVGFMDTPAFCGTLCHDIMEPEYAAYLRSPHSRVKCVACHIGPGASWAVRSKIDGLRQVWHAFNDSYTRPIPSPVHELRPARDTCEQCHWPAKFHGNRLAYRAHYRSDEENSAEVNVLALKVGGQNPRTGRHEGIHWHVSPDVSIVYEALDDKRETIGRVTVHRSGEEDVVYERPGKSGPTVETRTMDCVDCHNRPTHGWDGSAEEAVDLALHDGRLDAGVPYLRKLALPLLAREDRPREGVQAALRTELAAAYAARHPDLTPEAAALDQAAAGLADVYLRNIYPPHAHRLGHLPDPSGPPGRRGGPTRLLPLPRRRARPSGRRDPEPGLRPVPRAPRRGGGPRRHPGRDPRAPRVARRRLDCVLWRVSLWEHCGSKTVTATVTVTDNGPRFMVHGPRSTDCAACTACSAGRGRPAAQ